MNQVTIQDGIPARRRVMPTLKEMHEAYLQVGENVHKAGALLGISHATVHSHLRKAGLLQKYLFTEAEKARIEAYYRETPVASFDLDALAAELSRPKTNISRFARGRGLTDRGRPSRPEVLKQRGEALSAHWREHGHPRGALGLVHSSETRERIGEKSKESWLVAKTFNVGIFSPENRQKRSDRMTTLAAARSGENTYSRCVGGRREDIGPMYFRSKWEANYARYLNWLASLGEIDGWEYEPTTFWFEAIKRGVRSYKPDFLIHEKGKSYFVEVKGWMDPKSKTKLARMKRYHPGVEVRLVGERQYKAIASKVSRLIKGWE